MPSDVPPIRQIRPAAAGTSPAGAVASAGGQEAAKPDHAPTIVNPALRRYWHRDSEVPEPPRTVRRQIAQQGVFWAMLLGVFIALALVFDRGIAVVEAPRPRLGVVVSAPIPTRLADPALPIVVARPELAYAYGNGAVIAAERAARQYGTVSAYAVACGRQLPTWPGKVSGALATDIAERLPMFERSITVQAWMRDFVKAQFRAGHLMADHNIATFGKETICAELPLSPDYGGAMWLARDAPENQ